MENIFIIIWGVGVTVSELNSNCTSGTKHDKLESGCCNYI